MMCLALAGKSGGVGGFRISKYIATAGRAPTSEANPNTHIALQHKTSISRRVQNAPSVCAARFARNRSIMDAILTSIDKHKFVGNQQGLSQLLPGVRLPAIDDEIERFSRPHDNRIERSRALLVLDDPLLQNSLTAGNNPST